MMKNVCLLLLYILLTYYIHGQKPTVTPEIAKSWKRVAGAKLSDNGEYFLYQISAYPRSEHDKLIISSTKSTWKRELEGFKSYDFKFTADNRKVIGRNEGDSLLLITLGSKEIEYLPGVMSFVLPTQDYGKWLVYQLKDSASHIVLRNLNNRKEWNFENVKDYHLFDDGSGVVLNRENSKGEQELSWIDLNNNLKGQTIWKGSSPRNYLFNKDFTALAFIAQEGIDNTANAIWLYKKGQGKALKIINDDCTELEGRFTIDELVDFGRNGNNIIFSLKEKKRQLPKSNGVNVDVWSYTDPKLQSNQLWKLKTYSVDDTESKRHSLVRLTDNKVVRLEGQNDRIIDEVGDYALVFCEGDGDVGGEWNWNATASTSVDLIDIRQGTRKRIFDKLPKSYYSDNNFKLSPDEEYVFYFNPAMQNYFSYSIATAAMKCLTCTVQAQWTSYLHRDEPDAAYRPFSTARFINNGKGILVYSQNDIFQLDVSGVAPPINLTSNYGKKNNIAFRLLFPKEEIKNGDRLILNAFDRNNNNNGYYSIVAGRETAPVLLIMQPNIFTGPDESAQGRYEQPVKAADANVYLVSRQSASEYPNLFLTLDFKKFTAVSNYYPEKKYNWLTSELHKWEGLNGDTIKGILYKPENFDSTKKYPVIFYYYEKLSEGLHTFIHPEYSNGVLNIPYFVTKDYLVFVPDIPKIMGHPGPSAVNSVVSAANYLSQFSWVDSTELGLQGHSFGGFETNYIITHSNKFAAAVPAASMTNFISCYGSILWLRDGTSRQRQYEIYHDAIGTSMWERPDFYIENSPVLYAHKVTTPVLMMNNISDGDVPFAQGVEFFTALRRLGKRAWMLQYDGEDHALYYKEEARKDFTIRMLQFFDHYLKNKPAPKWMTRGVPAKDKGIKDGLEYDTEIKTPGQGLLNPDEKQKIDSFTNRMPFTINIPYNSQFTL